MKKRAMAMLLVSVMGISMLTACGKDTNTTEETKASESTNAVSKETQETDTSTDVAPEEVITLKWYFKGELDKDTGAKERVLETVNELLEERYNLRIDVIDCAWGDYNTIINNVDAAQEVYDLRYVGGLATYEDLIAQDVLVDITDLMKEYAPTRYAAFEDYWQYFERDGRIYTCMNYQLMCNTEGMGVHESYLETAIAAIKETYGTMENYIKEALGVTDEMKQAFKDKVLA